MFALALCGCSHDSFTVAGGGGEAWAGGGRMRGASRRELPGSVARRDAVDSPPRHIQIQNESTVNSALNTYCYCF